MKRKNISRIAAILILCLLCALLFVACSNDEKTDPEGTGESAQSGTVTVETHQSPTETQATTEEITEPPTEKPTEAPTEEPTEETTEKKVETEPPKEPEPVIPEPSLLYLSYGNGTCSVAGIGTYTDQSVIIPQKSPSGDVVTAIEPRAFYENTSIRTVQIPSTVTSIGDMAFAGCPNLVYIMVDSANRCYRDINGVLYSLDRTVLIAYPAANQASTLELSSKITTISDMALYGCTYLKNIVFDGSPSEWERLKIGTLNYSLFSASVTFTDMDK